MSELSREARLGFRQQFREAREHAIRDAEGFQAILYALERFGSFLVPKGQKANGLNDYGKFIETQASKSSLHSDIPNLYRHLHMPFEELYQILRLARNDAMHQGAYARHLTTNAIALSLILEDALSEEINFKEKLVADYMIKGVMCAELWQPISFVRQIMLANNFSFLPIEYKDKWHFLSDHSIANALMQHSNGKRKENMAKTIDNAIKDEIIIPTSTTPVQYNKKLGDVFEKMEESPLLIMKNDVLVGIITSFDVL